MWKTSYATSQGVVDFHKGRNNQDAVSVWSDGRMFFAVINDGCHGNEHSRNEVGAQLSNRYLGKRGKELLMSGIKPRDFPAQMFPDYLEYLDLLISAQLLNSVDDLDDFIANYLKCTTVAMAADEDEVCVFWAGDGVVYLNNAVCRKMISENNRATYPAYNMYKRFGLVPQDTEYLHGDDEIRVKIPDRFMSEVFPAEVVQTIGIASDGLLDFPQLLDELKAHSNSRMGLQMCLNRISVIRSETTDNVSVMFAQRMEK